MTPTSENPPLVPSGQILSAMILVSAAPAMPCPLFAVAEMMPAQCVPCESAIEGPGAGSSSISPKS